MKASHTQDEIRKRLTLFIEHYRSIEIHSFYSNLKGLLEHDQQEQKANKKASLLLISN